MLPWRRIEKSAPGDCFRTWEWVDDDDDDDDDDFSIETSAFDQIPRMQETSDLDWADRTFMVDLTGSSDTHELSPNR